MQERKGGRAGAWESTPHRLFYPPSSFPQRLPIRQPQHSDPDTPCLLACLRCDNPWLGLECRASQARVPCSPRSQRTINSTLQSRESSHTNFLGQKRAAKTEHRRTCQGTPPDPPGSYRETLGTIACCARVSGRWSRWADTTAGLPSGQGASTSSAMEAKIGRR